LMEIETEIERERCKYQASERLLIEHATRRERERERERLCRL